MQVPSECALTAGTNSIFRQGALRLSLKCPPKVGGRRFNRKENHLFEEAASVDDGYYARHWGLRRHRVRDDVHESGPSFYHQVINTEAPSPSVSHWSADSTPYGEAQHTIDQDNSARLTLQKNYERFGSKLVWDTGGPFYSERVSVSEPTYIDKRWLTDSGTGSTAHAKGYFHSSALHAQWLDQVRRGTLVLSSFPTSDAALKGYGATAISNTVPTKPEMNLSTSIAELKDGLPSLIGAGLMKSRSLSSGAGEYLNYQFGILPVISDVKSVIDLTKRYEVILKQFKRDNGRIVRRRSTLVDKEYLRSETKLANQYASMGGLGRQSNAMYSANATMTKVGREKVWFSGAYSIAYPKDVDGLLSKIIDFNRVYGVIPTPKLAWELLPFSFLVDWFLNLGDVIENVSTMGSATRLAYGYVMCESEYSNTISGAYGPSYLYTRTGDPTKVTLSSSLVHTRKRRLKASPFGFNTDFGNLTGYQKSILTALGLSRLRM